MGQANGTRVGVLLADDHELIRHAVRRLLKEEPALEVVGEAVNFAQTFEMGIRLRPDVILLDLHMPDEYALTPVFIKSQLQLTRSRIVAMSLSGEDDEESRRLAESFGAVKLLEKARFGDELIPAILRLAGSSNSVRSARPVRPSPTVSL